MKENETLSKQKCNCRSITPLQRAILFFLLFLGIMGGAVKAQTILSNLEWNTIPPDDAPKQVPAAMVALGDTGYLYLNAHLYAKNIMQPRIEIILPPGFDFAGTTKALTITNASDLTPFASFGNPTLSTVDGKRKMVIYYTAHTNTMLIGDSLVMKIRIVANCNVDIFNPGNYVINVYAGNGDFILGGYREFQANVQKPTMRMMSTVGYETINFAQVKDTNLVSLDIDAQNGYVKSTLITLRYNGTIIYLDSFKINGTPLNLLTSNAGVGVYHNTRISSTNPNPNPTTTSQITYIRLDNTVLGGDITEIAKTLTFRATSNLGCYQYINTEIRNNLTNTCETWTGNQIILSLPNTGAAPTFTTTTTAAQFRKLPYFDPGDADNMTPIPDPYSANVMHSFCWDGTTPNYGVLVFNNSNSAPTSKFSFLTGIGHGTAISPCSYIDTTQIYFRASVRNHDNTADSIVIPYTRIPGNYITLTSGHIYTDAAAYHPILLNKSKIVTISLPISTDNQLPAGVKVEVQWIVYANPEWILDTYRARTTCTVTNPSYNNYTYYWNNARTENTCGEIWTQEIERYNTILYLPRFYAPGQSRVMLYPDQTYFYSNQTITGASNGTNTTAIDNPANDPTGERFAEYFVKMPAWLNLDTTTNIESAFTVGTTAPATGSGVYYGTVDGYKTYSVRYYSNISGLFNIKLKPVECTSDGIITDTIQVWVDWVSGTPEIPCRARLKKTSKIYSIVELNCIEPALKIEDLGVYRITRGLKDSGNDHGPDNGTLVPDTEITHYLFRVYDTGYFYIRGYVSGLSTNTYEKLISVIRYTTGGPSVAVRKFLFGTNNTTNLWDNTTSPHTEPFWDDATIEFKKISDGSTVTYPLSIPTVANADSIMVYYDGLAQDYFPHGGDSVFIKIPFRVKSGYGNDMGAFTGTTYGTKETAPSDWIGIYNYPDALPIKFRGIYYYSNGNEGASSTYRYLNFTSVCQSVDVLHYRRDHAQGYDNVKEVRNPGEYQKLVMRVPVGYFRTSNTFKLSLWKWDNTRTADITIPNPLVSITAEEDFATGDSLFTIDLTQIFDYSYDGSQTGITYNPSTGRLSGYSDGEFRYPIGDDMGGIHLTTSLGVTPAAPTQQACSLSVTQKAYYGTLRTDINLYPGLNYTGPRLTLTTSPQLIYVNAQQLSFSSITVQNPTGAYTNKNVWLYLKGNVENTYLVVGTDTIWGEGLDNCWLSIGDMGPLATKVYRLNFSYKGKDECVNDTITLYTVFDALDGGFTPTTSSSIESVPVCNRGTKRNTILDVVTPKTKIAGYITTNIPNSVNPLKAGQLHHMDAYTVNYFIDGKVSQGALNNPYVTIRVPAGQVYTDTTLAFGIAAFEYPAGSGFRPIPAAVRAAMRAAIGEDSDESISRTFTIYAKDLVENDPFMLPGWGADPTFGFTDLQRLFKIQIPFVPTCETDLTGIRFRANFYGTASCGKPCEDNGMQYISPTIYPDVYPEYSFQVHLNNINIDSRTYTPDKLLDTLVATFKKDLGAFTKEIKMGDYVRLRLPADVKVNGTITSVPIADFNVVSILGAPDGTVNADGERIYTLDLPVKQLNDSLYYGPYTDTITFVYYIPILYSPNPSNDCSAPRQELECQVVTNANFKEGICEPRPLSLGSGRVLIITINLDGEEFFACLNAPTPLTIACGGVTPVWFRDIVGTGGQLIAGNTFVYTPTVQKDTTFYIRAIYDYGGHEEEDFGLAPISVHMYPEAKAKFSADTVCVGTETHFTNLSTIGGVASTIGGGTPNTKKWYWYLDGAAVAFDSVQNPSKELTAGNHTVKLRVISIYDCVRDTTISVYVRSLPVPSISGSMDECFNACAVYKTETGKSNYLWTVENGTISGANNKDSVKVCWDMAYSPTRGHVKVTYTDTYGCASVMTDSSVLVRKIPSVAVINGDDNPCVNTEVTYTFEKQPDIVINNYVWTVTTGGNIVAGGGTSNNSVTVRWNDLGSQKITLFVSNPACSAPDTGKLAITVQGPDRPTITGKDTLCTDIYTGTDVYTYTTQTGMSDYVWHIEGGTITSGGSTHQVTVKWNIYGTGRLAVSYTDGTCGTFMLDTFNVKVIPCGIVDCSLAKNKFVTEDGFGIGFYTHLDDSWDLVPTIAPKFDSVTYLIGGLLHRSGITATIDSAVFPAHTTTNVTCIVFFGGISDTCEFKVTVRAACPDTTYDVEGHSYQVVDVAGLCWTSNMKATVYADGVTPIAWANPYFSREYPNMAFYTDIFGLLYTWYSTVGVPEGRLDTTPVGTPYVQGICPDGWHVPTTRELSLLNQYPAPDLKSTEYWIAPGTNLSGFTALPAGMYNVTLDKFVDFAGATGYWACDAKPDPNAPFFKLIYSCDYIINEGMNKGDGLSVRCVMNE